MIRRMLLSFLGSGYLRPAPGTWGSLATLPLAWALYRLGGPVAIVLAGAVLFFVGLRATEMETATGEDHDPSWIVIDEVVGQLIALLPVAVGAWRVGISPLNLWPGIVAAFLLFRLFDVWKPWLVGRADRRGDPIGVMLDDVIAGLFAAVVVVVLATVAHGALML